MFDHRVETSLPSASAWIVTVISSSEQQLCPSALTEEYLVSLRETFPALPRRLRCPASPLSPRAPPLLLSLHLDGGTFLTLLRPLESRQRAGAAGDSLWMQRRREKCQCSALARSCVSGRKVGELVCCRFLPGGLGGTLLQRTGRLRVLDSRAALVLAGGPTRHARVPVSTSSQNEADEWNLSTAGESPDFCHFPKNRCREFQ